MSGHPVCRDSLSMYGLFCHVNVPLMSGHPVDVDADSICWLYVPPKARYKNIGLQVNRVIRSSLSISDSHF